MMYLSADAFHRALLASLKMNYKSGESRIIPDKNSTLSFRTEIGFNIGFHKILILRKYKYYNLLLF